MANTAQFYKAILEGLDYRGTAFIQSFTTCQPEHGVADSMATVQANRVRDSRGMPQFVHNPSEGESYQETLDLAGNPNRDRDWAKIGSTASKDDYLYTVAHWATSEARFRRHFRNGADPAGMTHLDDLLLLVTQDDVVQRHVLDPDHRSYVPDYGVYIELDNGDGTSQFVALSRQMVLFCIERRKAWRMIQSRAGVENLDYKALSNVRAALDDSEVVESPIELAKELYTKELEGLGVN
jgi:pyruvate-ferredoxin/flavodoxin oxidoreductase